MSCVEAAEPIEVLFGDVDWGGPKEPNIRWGPMEVATFSRYLLAHCRHTHTHARAHTHTHTHNRLTAFVWDYPGRPVPEETLTNSHPS